MAANCRGHTTYFLKGANSLQFRISEILLFGVNSFMVFLTEDPASEKAKGMHSQIVRGSENDLIESLFGFV